MEDTKKSTDWRDEKIEEIRKLILEAEPESSEEIKWAKPSKPGIPVWYNTGMICTGETYKEVVKLTFAKGAFLKDPKGLFNSSLGGNQRRAIDIREGEKIDEEALKALIQEAVDYNKLSSSK